MNLLKSAAALLVVTLAGTAAFVASGFYDIGADTPHWALTESGIGLLRDRSIAARLADLRVPDLEDRARIAEGALHYDEMCTGCHLAPGMPENELRAGLYPQPPKLAEPWPSDPREQFWVIKHGIKMTAMPAWGRSHDDEAIWSIVAFVRKLPGLSPEQYGQLTQGDGDRHHEHGADHEHRPPSGSGS